MLDYHELLMWLYAGAAISGPDLAKQVTKDAYQALKTKIVGICGNRAKRAAEAVEADPSSADARARLVEAIGTIPNDDVAEVSEALAVLRHAMKVDPGAISAAETFGRIRLNVISGGDVLIEGIEGASSIDVDANATKDFTFKGVKMAGDHRGN